MKQISKTVKLHINKTFFEKSEKPYYFVEWETCTICETMFGTLRTKKKVTTDPLVFRTPEAARIYGESVEAVSMSICEDATGYRTIAYIFPKGSLDIIKGVSGWADEYSEHNLYEMFTIYTTPDTYGKDAITPVVRCNGKYFNMESKESYEQLLLSSSFVSAMNHATMPRSKKITVYEQVGTYDISPVGSYTSGVTGESVEAKQSRCEIIDAELERIEHYKNFLISMK